MTRVFWPYLTETQLIVFMSKIQAIVGQGKSRKEAIEQAGFELTPTEYHESIKEQFNQITSNVQS